jgi:hypothetical protein
MDGIELEDVLYKQMTDIEVEEFRSHRGAWILNAH